MSSTGGSSAYPWTPELCESRGCTQTPQQELTCSIAKAVVTVPPHPTLDLPSGHCLNLMPAPWIPVTIVHSSFPAATELSLPYFILFPKSLNTLPMLGTYVMGTRGGRTGKAGCTTVWKSHWKQTFKGKPEGRGSHQEGKETCVYFAQRRGPETTANSQHLDTCGDSDSHSPVSKKNEESRKRLTLHCMCCVHPF